MSIKPIDFQVQIPRVNEISKLQSDIKQKHELAEQQQSTVIQRKSQASVNIVHKKEAIEKLKINEKQKGSKEKQEKEKQENKGKYNSKSEVEEEQVSVIDIRL